MRNRFSRPSPAMVVASVSLFVALGGTSYAAATGSIDSREIKNSTVQGKDIKNSSLTGSDVASSGLTGSDVKADSLTGSDIVESGLAKVPSASQADSATTANSATTAGTATSAGTATTAGTANSIADNTVTSSKVVNGSLNGDDVGRASGSTSVNVANVPANDCIQTAFDTASGADMRNDALVASPEETWPENVNVSAENSNSVGFIRLNTCNPTAAAVDPPAVTFRWVAIDVVP